MARLVGRLILMPVLGMPGSVSAAIAQGADCSGSDDSRSNLPRVLVKGPPRLRGSDPAIAAAIEQTLERSPTFRQLMAATTVPTASSMCTTEPAGATYAPVFCWQSRRPDRTASFTSGWIAVARA